MIKKNVSLTIDVGLYKQSLEHKINKSALLERALKLEFGLMANGEDTEVGRLRKELDTILKNFDIAKTEAKTFYKESVAWEKRYRKLANRES